MTKNLLAIAATPGGAMQKFASFCLEFLPPFPLIPAARLGCLLLLVTGFASVSHAGDTSSAVLAWDPNPEPDIAGYRLNYGTASGVYSHEKTVQNATEIPVTGLEAGSTYFFVVAAFNHRGLTGPVSDEISYFVEPENPVNSAPTVSDLFVTTRENQALALTLNGNDPDGDALTFTVVSAPAHGTLTGAPPNLTYTPNAGFHGNDSFTYKANDRSLESLAATVAIGVTAINRAPTATAASFTTAEDVPQTVLLSGTDPNNDTLTFQIVSNPAHGVLTGVAPRLTYVPNADYHGPDAFTFQVYDGEFTSAAAKISITVTPVNDAPTVASQAVTSQANKPVSITLTGADKDRDSLTFLVISTPLHGTLSGKAPNFTYTPNSGFSGNDSFTFKANDGLLDSLSATISIQVSAGNRAPTVANRFLTTSENKARTLSLSGNDLDGDPLTFVVVTAPTNGTLTGRSPNLTFTPDFDFVGTVYLVYQANDGTTDSAPATITILVTPINHAPVAASVSLKTPENSPVSLTLSATDKEKNTCSFAVIAGPLYGTLSGKAPNLTYTPNVGFNGNDSFTYKANDGSLDSLPATVSIEVTAANRAPTADAAFLVTAEDRPRAVLLSGSDPDGDSMTFQIVSNPTHGSLIGTAPNLTYLPDADYNGSDSFTFQVSDGELTSATASVSIAITPVNDAPTAAYLGFTIPQNKFIGIMLIGQDKDGDALKFTVSSQPAHGLLSGTPPNLVYSPAKGFTGNDSFVYKVDDGKVMSRPATVCIRVTAIDHAPVAIAAEFETAEDTPLPVLLTGTDPDSDSLTYTLVSGPTHGSLIGAPPNVIYVPAADFHGPDQFSFQVADASHPSAPATISINVSPVNDAPTVADATFSIEGNSALTVNLTGEDVDSDELTFTIVNSPQHGNLSGDLPDLVYTPDTGFQGDDSFTFTANDGSVDSEPATITIVVAEANPSEAGTSATLIVTDVPANRAPLFEKKSITCLPGIENATYSKQSIAFAASDPDPGDHLAFSKVSGPSWLLISAEGSLSGKPGMGSAGINRFTIGATDSHGATAECELQIKIVANRLPLPWKLTRLGQGDRSDPATYAVGTFTLGGSGALGGKQDGANLGWQKLSGNGTITARISKLDKTGSTTRVGLMIRQSLAPDARQAFIGVDGNGKLHGLSRTLNKGVAKDVSYKGAKSENEWLRLTRTGKTIHTYRSTNGKTWKKVASSTLVLPKNCYIGISVSSGNEKVLNTSRFSNVRVGP